MKIKIKNKFLQSLFFRIILIVIGVGIIPCLILRAGILRSYEMRAVSLRTADIQNQCTILCNQLSSAKYLSDTSSDVINAELIQLTNVYNGRVMIVDQDCEIIQDTYNIDEGKTIVSEAVIQTFAGTGTNHYDKKNHYIEVTAPIMDAGGTDAEGVMLVSVSTDTIVDSLDILESKGNIILATLSFLMMVLALLIAWLVVRPLKKITQSIEAVTEGYVQEALHENTYTETEAMSDAFNMMMGRLKVLDDSRQEFVSNVSHELKTPLTSMKVLADALLSQEEAPVEMYREFMGDITEEIDRENVIITDLLSLVKMDRSSPDLNIQSTDINELLELILKRLKPIAMKKNVDVVFESFRPVTAEVDEVKMTLAFSNLVENAIKYNHEEGWVHVSLNADHKFFYVSVSDSGPGIAPEEHDHIFERFYRVDKSHSRELGGSGLGLAITRSAVIMHRGSVKVESEKGEGTTFTVRIPLNYIV
ncbi:Signal transduction histidine kinase [Hespellia stercorisuis DSM 15480]|uniref:histidine kinase n=1 Tax=Hespellia stercorisuis DSM 15480 TaxID=1121950 RepID=A0A1M6MPN9_9FIRM|nr:ATP-binding protein [Hespellia stercorisuis]SHJ85448.1 Signal transduction histidine kinase [Hespellia stercorisuis DSM 15480]